MRSPRRLPAARRCRRRLRRHRHRRRGLHRAVDGLLPLKTDPSLKVVLVEREYAGFGASGRNGGWASSIFPVSLAQVAKLYDHRQRSPAGRDESDRRRDRRRGRRGRHRLRLRAGRLSVFGAQRGSACPRQSHVAGSEKFGYRQQWRLLRRGGGTRHASAPPVCSAGSSPSTAPCCSPTGWYAGLADWVETHGGMIYENTAADASTTDSSAPTAAP